LIAALFGPLRPKTAQFWRLRAPKWHRFSVRFCVRLQAPGALRLCRLRAFAAVSRAPVRDVQRAGTRRLPSGFRAAGLLGPAEAHPACVVVRGEALVRMTPAARPPPVGRAAFRTPVGYEPAKRELRPKFHE